MNGFEQRRAKEHSAGHGLCFGCGKDADLVKYRNEWLCEDCEALQDCPLCGEAASYGHACPEMSN